MSGGIGSEASAATEMSAPAKLTLSLQVTGVRPDGYHLLAAEFVTVNLFDTLFIGGGAGGTTRGADETARGDHETPVGPASKLTVSYDPGDGSGWPWAGIDVDRRNLVVCALDAVGRTAPIRLVKRIPPGAGLGGGSADAAAVLRWAARTDLAFAASLGADVPFCVFGGRARVGGIGEVVDPLPYEERTFTLLVPPFGMDTAAVYKTWDELGSERNERAERVPPTTISKRPRWHSSPGSSSGRKRSPRRAVGSRSWREAARPGSSRARSPRAPRKAAQPGAGWTSVPNEACWWRWRPRPATTLRAPRPDRRALDYLPAARRCQRVAFNIFLCFFFRMRFRRFLISDPMSGGDASRPAPTDATRGRRRSPTLGGRFPYSLLIHSVRGPLGDSTWGRVKRNKAPPPFARSTVTLPPSSRATWATMARPRPDPGLPRALGAR